MYKVMIVEDDLTIAQLLAQQLARWEFETYLVQDFHHVLEEYETVQPHLVLLDITLPFYDGYYWCMEIRKVSKVPIIFLTSHTEPMDLIMAMKMGADDYLTKPLASEVVMAKIQALLRRTYCYQEDPPFLTLRGAIYHIADGSLLYKNQRIELTKNESRIMYKLLLKKNQIVSREQIMQALWDCDSFVDDNTLTVNMNRLRKKLADYGLHDVIVTKKGQGYVLYD